MSHPKARVSTSSFAIALLALLFSMAPLSKTLNAYGEERKWAVVVGINTYMKEVTPLRGAINDAEQFGRALIQYGGFDERNVFVLTSEMKKMTRLPSTMRKGISASAKGEDDRSQSRPAMSAALIAAAKGTKNEGETASPSPLDSSRGRGGTVRAFFDPAFMGV
jgi:hypothetical protein